MTKTILTVFFSSMPHVDAKRPSGLNVQVLTHCLTL